MIQKLDKKALALRLFGKDTDDQDEIRLRLSQRIAWNPEKYDFIVSNENAIPSTQVAIPRNLSHTVLHAQKIWREHKESCRQRKSTLTIRE